MPRRIEKMDYQKIENRYNRMVDEYVSMCENQYDCGHYDENGCRNAYGDKCHIEMEIMKHKIAIMELKYPFLLVPKDVDE